MKTAEAETYSRQVEFQAIGLYTEETGNQRADWYTLLPETKEFYRQKVRHMFQNPFPEKMSSESPESHVNKKYVKKPKQSPNTTLVSAAPVVVPGPTLKDLVAAASVNQKQYTRTEEIDPSLAKVLLEGNTSNRTISSRLVASLMRDIKEGRWVLTHQGIALDKDGRLLDGQHRLHAIVAADKSVMMNVTYNVATEAFNVIDVNNRPRSHADILRLTRGQEFEHVKMSLLNGAMKIIARLGGTPSSTRWTTSELSKMIDLFGTDAAKVIHLVNGYKGLGKAPVVAPFALVYPMHPQFCEEFLLKMRNKVGMTENQAAVWRAIERFDLNTDQSRARLAVVILRAIKAELAGEQYKSFTSLRENLSEDPAVRHFLYHRKRMGFPDIPAVAHAERDV